MENPAGHRHNTKQQETKRANDGVIVDIHKEGEACRGVRVWGSEG